MHYLYLLNPLMQRKTYLIVNYPHFIIIIPIFNKEYLFGNLTKVLFEFSKLIHFTKIMVK